MDLASDAIQSIVHPTAAFPPSLEADHQAAAGAAQPAWEDSQLNPRNRIDSLDYPPTPLWRIDGCTGLGTQFYTVPLFLSPVPPTRMDVFIPEPQPDRLRRLLDLSVAFHTKDSARLYNLAITRLIVRTLQLWVTTQFEDLAAAASFYRGVPFGTRLVFENLSLDIHQIRIRIGPNHQLERQLLSRAQLASFWGDEFPFPPEIDFADVQVVSVLHDSVCLVRIHGELYIFKALTSGAKYLYHELKTLCTLGPHPHVIPRPVHIVRKKTNFGGKRAIAGFTTAFQAKGSLRDLLPQLRIHGQLRMEDQFKWCIQLNTALEHLRSTSATYYPDLRLDNIVLSSHNDVVMVDFEQRGVWCEFAAPEVNSIEYMRLVAVDEETPDEVREGYQEILQRLVPNYLELEADKYTNPPDGYNVSWIALSPAEQEAAEVYMLGRIIWCIFEGMSSPQKAAVWQSYRWESELEFPEHRQTPPGLRHLIDRCTRGRRETLSRVITRQGSRLVLRVENPDDEGPSGVKEAARAFWEAELKVAEDFLAMRERRKAEGTWVDNHYDRPTLKEVLAELQRLQKELCGGSSSFSA